MIKIKIAAPNPGHNGSIPKGDPLKNQMKLSPQPAIVVENATNGWRRLHSTETIKTTTSIDLIWCNPKSVCIIVGCVKAKAVPTNPSTATIILEKFSIKKLVKNLLENEPLVSVIILEYNNYEDTVECIESVLLSSYSNFKIILVDNHSDIHIFNKLKMKYSNSDLTSNVESSHPYFFSSFK